MGPIVCPEISVRNYHYTLHNIPEEGTFYLLRSGSLKPPLRCWVNNGLLLASVLTQINAVSATPSYFSKTQFNVKLLSTPRHFKWRLPFTCSIKTIYSFLFSPTMPYARPSFRPWLWKMNNSEWEAQIRNFLIILLYVALCYFFLSKYSQYAVVKCLRSIVMPEDLMWNLFSTHTQQKLK